MAGTRRLILLPGMGADARLFRELTCAVPRLTAVDTLEPREGEPFSAYARRVAEVHAIGADDVIGGASFGGFVAAEIAAQRRCAGLVLIGSALGTSGIPALLALAAKFERWVPDGLLRQAFSADPDLVALVEPLTGPSRELLMEMFRGIALPTLRRAAGLVAAWPGVARESVRCPIHRIHGARDRVIRAAAGEVDEMVAGGGHILTLSHPREVTAFLSRRLATPT